MTTTDLQTAPVTVLGLGPMGTALAQALVRADVPTTVWNRTPERAQALQREGATAAADVESAVAASSLTVLCLRDHDASRDVLGVPEPSTYTGRAVVNLSSSTPAESRRTAAWATERGVMYLSGAIMVPTPLIGDPDALVLYSGGRAVYDQHLPLLRLLSGQTEHLGEDPGSASLYDVAMLEVFFAGMTAFLHATAMMAAQGVSAKTFLPYAQRVAALLPETFSGLSENVDSGEHPGTEDTLAMDLAAFEHIVDTSGESGHDARLPVLLRDLARAAVESGHGADAFSRVVDELR